MKSRTKEIFESIVLIFIFNYLWVFIHSYLNNYLLFRPISSDLALPQSIFLWNTYIGLVFKIAKFAFVNSLSMSVVVLFIIFNKNADTKFQTLISLLIFLFNILFFILARFLFKSIHLSAYNLFTYTLYFLIPWILFLVVYNKYYISGFGHIVLYSVLFTFFFTVVIIMRNNSMVFKEAKYKKELLAKEKNILQSEFKEKDFSEKSAEVNKQNIPKAKVKRQPRIKKQYPDTHIYPFRSGQIYYEISGDGINAKETVCFDHYGLREATVTETEYSNGKKEKQLILLDNDYIFFVDLNVKIGTIAHSDLIKNLGEDTDYNKILKYRLRQFDPIQVGMGYVLGKNCKIWVSRDKKIKLWTWKGLILKKIIYKKNYPSVVYEAKDIKVDVSIPNEKFEIPKDVKFIRYKKPPKS